VQQKTVPRGISLQTFELGGDQSEAPPSESRSGLGTSEDDSTSATDNPVLVA
jgi:hypothetical protein